jgi:2-methylcitrate dehydratase PrpD
MAEQLMGGFTIKIVQGGQAASAGIMAAGLARQGITGTPYVLEGSVLDGGFCKITSGGKPNYEKLIASLGDPFSIMDVYFKPFTACRHTHGPAQAVLSLMKERPLDPDDIEAIRVFTYGIAQVAVGKGMSEPGSIVSAQFSIPYVVAACLLDGELGPRQLTEKRMSDPRLIALSNKVSVQTDDELNATYPDKTPGRVEISTRWGECLVCQVDIPYGDPRNPLDADGFAPSCGNLPETASKAAWMRSWR